uniref:Uncharacterized protein n=1 Tax=Octopus bimaculoides TaxID=37653 RepID=A0A0L8HRJ8_OCTBM
MSCVNEGRQQPSINNELKSVHMTSQRNIFEIREQEKKRIIVTKGLILKPAAITKQVLIHNIEEKHNG